MLADGRTVIGHENWRAHQASATFGQVSEPGGAALKITHANVGQPGATSRAVGVW
jgi:hypothetical protein